MLRAIDEIRPTWVVGENVAGITTMVEGGVLTPMGCDTTLFGEGDGLHRYELRQTFTIERICRDLEGLGYTVQPMLIPAAAVGAPHRRDRIFLLAYAENSISDRPGIGSDDKQGDKRDFRNTCTRDDERLCGEKRIDSSNTYGNRRRSMSYQRRKEDLSHGQKRRRIFGETSRHGKGWSLAETFLRPERRWRRFPTVSPVHAGNDGLPIRMDGVSIPFTKWRTEALKAYGNAIVPQVMYRIFQAIEKA